MKAFPFELVLFSIHPPFISRAVKAGVGGIIVDWERLGKADRQAGADTQLNHATLEDLRQVRASTDVPVLCRINGCGETTAAEVEEAVGGGADEILLPMVRSVEEVERVLERVRGRCGVGILVETVAATRLVDKLASLPLSRVYVGLNDLAIERKTPNIFTAVADGTLEQIRDAFRDVPFGFGGLTLPERGEPIPCRLLIGEMARLDCAFSFLRRSFYRDIQGRDLAVEIPRILEALEAARQRNPETVDRDRLALKQAIARWTSASAHEPADVG
jgi:hypothetical protein